MECLKMGLEPKKKLLTTKVLLNNFLYKYTFNKFSFSHVMDMTKFSIYNFLLYVKFKHLT